MKLYTFDPAPNPRRLQLFMDYKGIKLDSTQIDMMAQAQLGDDYRAINPSMTLPALVLDDGTVLTEVIGMCAYLEELHPQRPLLGTNALEKAQVLGWDHKLFNMVMMPIAEVLRNANKGFVDRALPGPLDVAQIPALAERGSKRLAFAWQALEAEISADGWLAGDHFSLADLDLLICIEFSGWIKQSPGDDCPKLAAFAERVKAELA